MKKFTVENQRKYMRIPFKEHGRDFDGCDCGGLVWVIYKNELGIELPDGLLLYQNTKRESFQEVREALDGVLDSQFMELSKDVKLQSFDVVSLAIGGLPVHVGVMTTPCTFIHILDGYTSVRQERIDCLNWSKRLDGVFRHKDFCNE